MVVVALVLMDDTWAAHEELSCVGNATDDALPQTQLGPACVGNTPRLFLQKAGV